MVFQLICKSKCGMCSHNFLLFLFLTSLSSVTFAEKYEPINIGAIIDVDSRAGKEQQIAMKMAVQSFNDLPANDQKLALHFKNISNNPILAVSAAEQLIKENQVKVIIGLEIWEQSVLVADVGQKAEVPVLSLAPSSKRPLFMQQRWPFLMSMVPNILDQITCITEVIDSFNWRKIVPIYEDNSYGGDSELIAVLSEALQEVDAEIESHFVLPPLSSVPDPEGMIRDEVAKMLRLQSRVFVVLRSSLTLAHHLFKEAKKIGLMGRDSVWIISSSLSDLLDSVEPSTISSMQGVIGIKTFYSENTILYQSFKQEFERNFRVEFPYERNLEPGIHALRAYDAITAVSKAVTELINQDRGNDSMSLLRMIQSNNFTGLTGDIRYQGSALSGESVFSIVNVVGKSYKELGYWSPSFSFADSQTFWQTGMTNISAGEGFQTMQSLVIWPVELNRIPKGWAMPTAAEPMIIGVPEGTTFDEFVKVDRPEGTNNSLKITGFCIAVFEEALKIVEETEKYTLFYEFEPYNGRYDQLVEKVINKTYNAAVGDITILANRSKLVDFTHPFAESGLSMMVQVKQEYQQAWMFMRPFTVTLWVATFAIMFYTMLIVWFMEHQTNPQFRGPWKDQLGTAMWFTFSSLFFAHRENIKSNCSRAVLVVWLFLVFVLTSSYTASLTSMLTISNMEPNVTDIAWIRRTNAPVGCDGDSFVLKYLQNVLDLRNIKTIENPEDYPLEFDSRNITAAFLELPYQKLFLREHCNDYTVTGPTYRFGGQGFVFQKGSPITRDFSKAILKMMENGDLERLEREWLVTSANCSNSSEDPKTESLHFESFWGLFLISGSTSTICLIIFVVRLLKTKRKSQQNGDVADHQGGGNKGINGIVDMVVDLTPYTIRNRSIGRSMERDSKAPQSWSSSRWDLISPVDPSEQFEASHRLET